MKKIIIGFLTRGYTTTRKYTLDDLTKAFYPLKYIAQQDGTLIRTKNNSFWSCENTRNRLDLIADLVTAKLGNIRSGFYHILNRYENGDKYGIERGDKK